MILSDGVLVKSPNITWQGTTRDFPGFLHSASRYAAGYSEIYRTQPWVHIVVNKLAMGEARLPLPVYLHDDMNRPRVTDHPYARLLARPNDRQSRFEFWLWMISTFDVYGEAFAAKVRDGGGRPVQLVPLHPSGMREADTIDGEITWDFDNGKVRFEGIRTSDLLIFRNYNPDSFTRGLSRLEPLRRTLEFEDAAQRAQSSFWVKGARPGMILKHPGNISQPAADRLKVQWNAVAAGPDNFGTTVVLEEGMNPEVVQLSAEEAAYIDSRKLNREEVCGAYDVPPPAVHILDRATFSNITEQLRSLYRDTHAPRLQMFEGALEHQLRGSVNRQTGEPDFGDEVYAEFLLDEVLRGDFEQRADAYAKADYMTMAEKRRAENLPFIEGTERIFVNAATVPLDAAAFNAVGGLVRAGYEPEAVLSAMGLPQISHTGLAPITVQADDNPVQPALRTLMGRLARATDLASVNPDALVAGLEPDAEPVIRTALALSVADGHTVAEFRGRLKALAGGNAP